MDADCKPNLDSPCYTCSFKLALPKVQILVGVSQRITHVILRRPAYSACLIGNGWNRSQGVSPKFFFHSFPKLISSAGVAASLCESGDVRASDSYAFSP